MKTPLLGPKSRFSQIASALVGATALSVLTPQVMALTRSSAVFFEAESGEGSGNSGPLAGFVHIACDEHGDREDTSNLNQAFMTLSRVDGIARATIVSLKHGTD